MSHGGSRSGSGAKPKPTHLKVVEGSKRPINEDEPDVEPVKEAPPPPDTLSDKAKEAWVNLADKLMNMGVLAKVDLLALERMSECYAKIMECQEQIDHEGLTYWQEGQHGSTLKANPAVIQLRGFEMLFKSYLTEFGMTPSSRTRVSKIGGNEGAGDGLLD
jgi:P27 family predicted phage terminase small subunit